MLIWKLVSLAIFFLSFLFAASIIIFKKQELKERMAAEREKMLLPGYKPTVIGERRKFGER